MNKINLGESVNNCIDNFAERFIRDSADGYVRSFVGRSLLPVEHHVRASVLWPVERALLYSHALLWIR